MEALKAAQAPVRERLARYGDQQFEAVNATIGRFIAWMESNGLLTNVRSQEFVDALEIDPAELSEMRSEVTRVRNWVRGAATGAVATAVAPEAAILGVSALGTAGTGAAISSLYGAAAENAILAWLGGGPLAAGGGGVAAGQVVLGAIAVAPAVFIGGLTAAIVGSKQRTSSENYAAEVAIARARVQAAVEFLPELENRIEELSGVLTKLTERAAAAISELENVEFDPARHAALFSSALQLVRAIREVVNVPVLEGDVNEPSHASLRVIRKYR